MRVLIWSFGALFVTWLVGILLSLFVFPALQEPSGTVGVVGFHSVRDAVFYPHLFLFHVRPELRLSYCSYLRSVFGAQEASRFTIYFAVYRYRFGWAVEL